MKNKIEIFLPGNPFKPQSLPTEVIPTISCCRSSYLLLVLFLFANNGPPLSPWQASLPALKKNLCMLWCTLFCLFKKDGPSPYLWLLSNLHNRHKGVVFWYLHFLHISDHIRFVEKFLILLPSGCHFVDDFHAKLLLFLNVPQYMLYIRHISCRGKIYFHI